MQFVLVMDSLDHENLRLTTDNYDTKDTEIGHDSTPAYTES